MTLWRVRLWPGTVRLLPSRRYHANADGSISPPSTNRSLHSPPFFPFWSGYPADGLQVFVVEGLAARVEGGGNDQAVVEAELMTRLDVQG